MTGNRFIVSRKSLNSISIYIRRWIVTDFKIFTPADAVWWSSLKDLGFRQWCWIYGGRYWGQPYRLRWLDKPWGWRKGGQKKRAWRAPEGVKRGRMMGLCARGCAHPRGCWRRWVRFLKTQLLVLVLRSVGFLRSMPARMLVLELFVLTNTKCPIGMTFVSGGVKVSALGSLIPTLLFHEWVPASSLFFPWILLWKSQLMIHPYWLALFSWWACIIDTWTLLDLFSNCNVLFFCLNLTPKFNYIKCPNVVKRTSL